MVVVTQQEEDGMTKAEVVKDLVLSWPELFDHQEPELNACCLVMYVKFNLTGQMWSISQAFVAEFRYVKTYGIF